MLYNVEVRRMLIWMEWTPNKAKAMGELMAWRRLGYQAQLREKRHG